MSDKTKKVLGNTQDKQETDSNKEFYERNYFNGECWVPKSWGEGFQLY